jgi:hypothetical protein
MTHSTYSLTVCQIQILLWVITENSVLKLKIREKEQYTLLSKFDLRTINKAFIFICVCVCVKIVNGISFAMHFTPVMPPCSKLFTNKNKRIYISLKRTHAHTHMCTHTCRHAHMHTHMHARTHMNTHTHTHAHVHAHTCTHTCMHTHTHHHHVLHTCSKSQNSLQMLQ